MALLSLNLLVVLTIQKPEGTVLLRLVSDLVKIVSRVALHVVCSRLVERYHLLLRLALAILLYGPGVNPVPNRLAHRPRFVNNI